MAGNFPHRPPKKSAGRERTVTRYSLEGAARGRLGEEVWNVEHPHGCQGAGRGLLGAILAIELTQVGIAVLLNAWNARFYDALQNKNAAAFGYELLIFAALVATLGSELTRRGRLASAGDTPALPGRQ